MATRQLRVRRVERAPVDRLAPLLGGGALVAYGLSRRSAGGVILATLGAGLFYRGVAGGPIVSPGFQQLVRQRAAGWAVMPGQVVYVRKTMTIDRPREELFRVWRDLANLPRFMSHLQSVTRQGDGRSHWVAKGRAGPSIEWDAETVEEHENELIRWRSLPGAAVPNWGTVVFRRAPGDRGTELSVELTYDPPAGPMGVAFGKLFDLEPAQSLREGLRRFKALMEAGELPTTKGQPVGRRL